MSTGTPPATGVEANERLAAAMYPEPPPRLVDVAPNAAVQALRDAEPARVLYAPHEQYGGAIKALSLATNPEGTAESLSKQGVALGAVAADLGLDQHDVENWASIAERFAAKPPTADEKAAFQRTAVKELRAAYGEAYDDVVADVRALANRDPRVAGLFVKTGIAHDPGVVLRMAELARTARARGLLPRK